VSVGDSGTTCAVTGLPAESKTAYEATPEGKPAGNRTGNEVRDCATLLYMITVVATPASSAGHTVTFARSHGRNADESPISVDSDAPTTASAARRPFASRCA